MNRIEAGVLGLNGISVAANSPEVIDAFSNNRILEGSVRSALIVVNLAIVGLIASGKLKYSPSHSNPPQELVRAFLEPVNTQEIDRALKTLGEIASDPQSAENGAVIHLDNDLILEFPQSFSKK